MIDVNLMAWKEIAEGESMDAVQTKHNEAQRSIVDRWEQLPVLLPAKVQGQVWTPPELP